MEKIVPFMIGDEKYVPSQSRRTFLEEIALGICVLFEENGNSMKKWGLIDAISICFWPVRLIPLNDNHACVCSYLFNSAPKIPVGPFKKTLPNPEAVIKASDSSTFIESLSDYDSKYLSNKSNFSRKISIQEALFGVDEISYLKPFLYNQYSIKSFEEKYFNLSADPISKSVNQINIRKEVYDFVNLADVKIIEQYNEKINNLCDKWIDKASKELDAFKVKTVDHSKEERQLERLNKELREEKERDLHDTDEELLASGKFKINNMSSVILKEIESLKNEISKISNFVRDKNLNRITETIQDSYRESQNVQNSIKSFDGEIATLKKNLARERDNIRKNQADKISALESEINEVKAKIDSDEKNYHKELFDIQNNVKKIQELKQKINATISSIKETELDNVQQFLQQYSVEIKTNNVILGIPILVFNFKSQKTDKFKRYMPVLPILISEGKRRGPTVQIKSKTKSNFTVRFNNLFNKDKAIKDLVSSESQNNNLIEIKNFTAQLLESVDELRIKEMVSKKIAANVKDLIESLI